MRSIRIVKQKQNENAIETTREKKSVKSTTREIEHTIKSWIAESEQHRRKQLRSLAAVSVLVVIACTVAMGQSAVVTSERALTPEERVIKVTIATTDGFLGPTAARFKVGEEIPVTITMMNTSKDALYTCISSDVYQDLPKLTHDGKVVPYAKYQTYETVSAKRNHVCEEENLPEPVLLRPNEPRVADWFLLVSDRSTDGADAWYDPLPAGKYELTIQRRLACCNGPMVESNKISFEVVP